MLVGKLRLNLQNVAIDLFLNLKAIYEAQVKLTCKNIVK